MRASGFITSAFVLLLASCSRPPEPPPVPQATNTKPLPVPPPLANSSLYTPDSRKPEEVSPNERNPFGVPPPPPKVEEKQVLGEEETVESKLRRALGMMRVSGFSGAPGDYSVLLGPMLLREGDVLPKLFSDQKENLKVQSINIDDTKRGEMVLAFDEDNPKPRTIGISFDTKPRVGSVMMGEAVLKVAEEAGKEQSAYFSVKQYLESLKSGGRAEAILEIYPGLMGDMLIPRLKMEKPDTPEP